MLPLVVMAARAAAQSFSSGITSGTISNSAIVEASGIVASHLNPNVLWTHNDSGNPADLFPTTAAGANLGTYAVSGAGNTDWEDIAIGPGPTAGKEYIYVGDIGDNNAVRSTIAVYRVPEPTVSATQQPGNFSISGAAKFTFQYPDGPRNAESMFVDPLTKDIYIITKFDAPKRVYRAAYPQSTSETTTLEFVTSFPTTSSWLTAADISPDGEQIIVRSTATTSGRLYIRPPGGSIADAFATTPISIPLLAETQGEAIGFDAQGWGYYTTSEGANPPIHYFDRLPAHAVWIASTGTFALGSNWDTGTVPGSGNSVHFGQTATGAGKTYTVNFGGNTTTAVAIVHRDNVTWNLNGATFSQSGYTGVDSLIVGTSIGENAMLTILNGTVSTTAGSGGYSQIGRGVGASGVITIGSAGKWINTSSLLIGRLGTGTLNVTAGGSATLSNVYVGGGTSAAGGTGAFNVTGGIATISGTFKIWNNGSLSWSSGSLSTATLSMVGGGKTSLASGGDKVLRATTVSIDSSSKLDLSNNHMIVDYSGASPIAMIQSLIKSGCNNGAWTGNGIASSRAAAIAVDSSNAHKSALGFADANHLFASFPASFIGQTVDSTSVLVRYTLAGDANLDGKVNALDFNALAANFGSPLAKFWSDGDFNYDGITSSADFIALSQNFNQAVPSPTLGSIVPEPVLLLPLTLLVLRRRVTSAPVPRLRRLRVRNCPRVL
jgi:T5SS/PEP-CTERM-associated repeat protein